MAEAYPETLAGLVDTVLALWVGALLAVAEKGKNHCKLSFLGC